MVGPSQENCLLETINDCHWDKLNRLENDVREIASKQQGKLLFIVGACISFFVIGVSVWAAYSISQSQESLLSMVAQSEAVPLSKSNVSLADAARSMSFDSSYGKLLLSIVPAMVILMAGWMGFMGMRRLNLYDSEMSRIRETIDGRIDSIRNENREVYADIKKSVASMTKTELEKQANAVRTDFTGKIREESQRVGGLIESLKQYDFLREYAAPLTLNDMASKIGSLEGVAADIRRLFSEANKLDQYSMQHDDPMTKAKRDHRRKEAIQIVNSALEHDISGDPDDYFNVATCLANEKLYSLSLKVLQKGVSIFPSSVDILSTAINNSVQTGNLNLGMEYLQALQNISFDNWNWRAFTFAIQFCVTQNNAEQAKFLYEKSINHLPMDERPAVQYAKLFIELGKTRDAAEMLQGVVSRGFPAPQATSTLARLYLSLGEAEKSIEIGQIAAASDINLQSTTNMSSILFHIGMAKDMLFLREAQKVVDVLDAEASARLLEKAGSIFAYYKGSLRVSDSLPVVASSVALRIETIKSTLLSIGIQEQAINDLLGELSEKFDGNAGNKQNSLSNLLMRLATEDEKEVIAAVPQRMREDSDN
jgi:tetratricopeptide (TPR) repeat protein